MFWGVPNPKSAGRFEPFNFYPTTQDRAWKDSTRSIFDLETLEIEAERMGVTAPWANADAGDEILPGFDGEGKMRIGGT